MSTPTLQPPLVNGHPREVPAAAAPRRRTPVVLVAVCAAAIGAALTVGLLLALGVVGSSRDRTTVVERAASSSGTSATAPLDAKAIYAGAAPGVVDITANGVSSGSNDSLAPPDQSQTTATGTGSVVDGSGDILTAAHVVSGASSISVKLQDGTTRSAKVLGTDDSTDVAVLKIDPTGLTLHPIPLGSSGSLAVGDPLAVIGDPFQFNRSLSTGVVSALDRTIQAPNGFTVSHAIQTDAAIDPGNSGGPLLDAHGRLVGIVDQIATGGGRSDSFTGVGFAVPIDGVKSELSQLERGGHVTHAYLGVATADATQQQGALVQDVPGGGPAATAGLRSGDVVTAIDGSPVHGTNDLVSAISARRPGEQVKLTVLRGSSQLTLTATLAPQPSQASTG